MTFPAMHPSEAVAPHSARGQNSSLLNQAVAASVHGGISHSHSSSSQAKTSAALSSQRANSAATACAAQLWSSLFVFMPSFGLTFNL